MLKPYSYNLLSTVKVMLNAIIDTFALTIYAIFIQKIFFKHFIAFHGT